MTAVDERARAIIDRLPVGGRAAEIGVLVGTLSQRILTAPQRAHLVMVDNWAIAEDQPEAYRATRDVHADHEPQRVAAHERAARRVARAHPARARVIKARSTEAVMEIDDRSLDLVFIDADHSYEGCLADIRAWLPKVKPGGWIGGHDYHNPDPNFRFGVDRAVDEWSAETGRAIETDRNFTWWSKVG